MRGLIRRILINKRYNLRNFLQDFATLGLQILITQVDIIYKKLPVNSHDGDRIVASAYEEYLSVVLDEPAVIAVLTWGLSDIPDELEHKW